MQVISILVRRESRDFAPGKVVILRQAWMEPGYFIVLLFEFMKDEFYISSYKLY